MKVVVCDIDGTLIAPDEDHISYENIQAIHQLHRQGITFILATGRVFQGIEHLIPLLGLDQKECYAICNNGAEIYRLDTKEVIYRKTVDKEYLTQIHAIVDNKAAYLLNQENYGVMSKYNSYGIQHDHDKINYDFYWPQDITKHFNQPTTRVMVTEQAKILDYLEPLLIEKLHNKVAIARNNDIFLDITHIEADKAIALEYLLSQLGYTYDDVIACGDGGNDIKMLQKAKIGLVLENAKDDVKKTVGNTSIHAKDHIVKYVLDNYINKSQN